MATLMFFLNLVCTIKIHIHHQVTTLTERPNTRNLPCPPPPHRSPHHPQSRWKTSFSVAAAAAGAAAEPWPSQAFDKAAEPQQCSPLWTLTLTLIRILYGANKVSRQMSRVSRVGRDRSRECWRRRDALTAIDVTTNVSCEPPRSCPVLDSLPFSSARLNPVDWANPAVGQTEISLSPPQFSSIGFI